jgi:hypothetical protein
LKTDRFRRELAGESTPTHETTHALGIDREQYASGPS